MAHSKSPIRLEGITVCNGYADFLAATLPYNKALFDHLLVVTGYEDKETQHLCRDLSVECRPTDVFYKNGDPFAKARAIDWGLSFLRRDAWILHHDSDILLPPDMRNILDIAELDDDCIYGADRFNCIGYDHWKRYVSGHRLMHRHHCLMVPPPFPMGARLVLRDHSGYLPIGYFQLFHGRHGRRYPLHQGDAERTDVQHSLQWPGSKRHLLGELYCVHLESESTAMGVNWRGRKSRRFGPRPVHGNHCGYGG